MRSEQEIDEAVERLQKEIYVHEVRRRIRIANTHDYHISLVHRSAIRFLQGILWASARAENIDGCFPPVPDEDIARARSIVGMPMMSVTEKFEIFTGKKQKETPK